MRQFFTKFFYLIIIDFNKIFIKSAKIFRENGDLIVLKLVKIVKILKIGWKMEKIREVNCDIQSSKSPNITISNKFFVQLKFWPCPLFYKCPKVSCFFLNPSLRLYVSHHSLSVKGKGVLKLLAQFVISCYGPSWFQIKGWF